MTTMKGRAYVDPHERCAHRRYWLTCAEYDAIREAQRGRCARCGEDGFPLVIDHDHGLGLWAVRGLLCHLCNIRLRDIDAGLHEAGPETTAYLESAWHLSQPPRVKPERHEKRGRRLTAPSVPNFRLDQARSAGSP